MGSLKNWFYFFSGFALMNEEITPTPFQYTAEAKELKTGKVIYYEKHQEFWQGKKHTHSEVRYTNPEGKTFAQKKIVFEKSKIAPDFTTEDYRSGYLVGAELIGPNKIRLFTRDNQNSPLKEKILEFQETVVVDGGFDYFIRENWQKLMDGQKLSFLFTVPARLTAFRFRLYRNGEEIFLGRTCVKFTLEFDNIFLRIFLDGFSLYYDKETKRLVSFRGLSNIPSGTGINYIAEINFPPLPTKE